MTSNYPDGSVDERVDDVPSAAGHSSDVRDPVCKMVVDPESSQEDGSIHLLPYREAFSIISELDDLLS